MRQFLKSGRRLNWTLVELRLDIEILRALVRQHWIPRRLNARLRRSMAWRRDLLRLIKYPDVMPALSEDERASRVAAASGGTVVGKTIADEVKRYVVPSPDFEEVDSGIVRDREKLAKVIAFYLPQFHAFPENDLWWGKGFTEWTNVARAIPRFEGHYQPRIPRDLGFYDLLDDHTMRRQVEMAKAAGLHGFCFYYYNFDGHRLLERPLDRFLADPSLDIPFCLMWANENWTRRWDGAEFEVLMKQSYDEESAEQLVDDFARHMHDPRYIRVDGRPLLIIYRPNVIPKAEEMVRNCRRLFQERHGLEPVLLMVQAFGSDDPTEFGFDGAIEFPPHKLQHRVMPANDDVVTLDPSMTGQIFHYRDFASASMSFRPPEFPLIKTIFPSWDNEARRQGRGMSTVGSTPELYGQWLDRTIRYARRNPAFGEPFVFVNAWNEWAEGTYLEPDVHFGGAYLNETARRIIGTSRLRAKPKVLLVGHDANPHGAQELLLNIGEMLKKDFGCEIEFMLCGSGPILERYERLAPTTVVDSGSIDAVASDYAQRGFEQAIVNSLASGMAIEPLASRLFRIVTLVHELPDLIRRYGLERAAANVANASSEVIFPSAIVRDAFCGIVGDATFRMSVQPQGLYKQLVVSPSDREDVRRELGLTPGARIVLNVGYGDMRKGIDIFAEAARNFPVGEDVHFVWVGLVEEPTRKALGAQLDLGNLHFLGARDDVGRLLAASDVFALTSREDPFPSVVLEALAMGLPVIAFEGGGGFVDLFDAEGTGTLVPMADASAMSDAIRTELAREAADRAARAAARSARIEADFSFRDYVFSLLQRFDPDLRRVSVVVPSYNYKRYLDGRLRSIFDQTYPVYETIVLDDASTDDSIGEIEAVVARNERRVRLVVNEANSGNVFRQWRRGVEMAKGDLVWIAEADDLAEVDFLATLAQQFARSRVDLAFTDSSAIDAEGTQLSTSYRRYYSYVGEGALETSLVADGAEFAENYLSQRNLILNVSGVVFRREKIEQALRATPDVTEFSIAGDWLLYLRICAMGGEVAYDSRSLNIHRRANGVTKRTRGETQLREIARLYELYDSLFPDQQPRHKRREEYLEELSAQFLSGS